MTPDKSLPQDWDNSWSCLVFVFLPQSVRKTTYIFTLSSHSKKLSCSVLHRGLKLIYYLQTNDKLVIELNEPKGRIRGHVLKTGIGNDYYAFQEIPFAAPPVGENRFKVKKVNFILQNFIKRCYFIISILNTHNEIEIYFISLPGSTKVGMGFWMPQTTK